MIRSRFRFYTNRDIFVSVLQGVATRNQNPPVLFVPTNLFYTYLTHLNGCNLLVCCHILWSASCRTVKLWGRSRETNTSLSNGGIFQLPSIKSIPSTQALFDPRCHAVVLNPKSLLGRKLLKHSHLLLYLLLRLTIGHSFGMGIFL